MRNLVRISLLAVALAVPGAAAEAQRAPGWIGIGFEIWSERNGSDPSIVVTEVREGSPAATAGIEVGDRLLTINQARTAAQLAAANTELKAANEVKDDFGEEICKLVDGVTKLTGITFQSRDDRQAETTQAAVRHHGVLALGVVQGDRYGNRCSSRLDVGRTPRTLPPPPSPRGPSHPSVHSLSAACPTTYRFPRLSVPPAAAPPRP